MKTFVAFTAFAAALGAANPAHAQGEREIALLAVLGQEQLAREEAAAAARQQAALEAETRLLRAYREYLTNARVVARKVITSKLESVNQEKVESLRRQARIIIEEVTPDTKQRVIKELDPIYQQLESVLAATSDELAKASPELLALRRKVAPGSGRALDWIDDTAVMYALCTDKNDQAVIQMNIGVREQLTSDEAQAIDLTNRRRLVLGLRPLAIDMKLVECARDHSNDMVTLGFFSHNSPVAGKASFQDRAKNFGTEASGENIAAGYNTGVSVVIGWWYSPGHLKNMMSRGHGRIAVGQKDQTYTQMFGR